MAPKAIIRASSSHPCLVAAWGCPNTIEVHGFCCKSCWAKLPEGVQRELPRVIAGRELSRGMKEHVIGQALARLGCEIAGPLLDEELVEANRLTPLCHAFQTFDELLNAENGYWPKWSVQDLKGEEYRNTCHLADLYDRAMVARGDSRRATRLGFAGL